METWESSFRQQEKLLELSDLCLAHIEETVRYYGKVNIIEFI